MIIGNNGIFSYNHLKPALFFWISYVGLSRIKKLFPDMKIKDEKDFLLKLEDVYSKKVKPRLQNFKKRLAPFLIDEKKFFILIFLERQ